jgi:hypothetical protein
MDGYKQITFDEWVKVFFKGETVTYVWFGKKERDMTIKDTAQGCSFISFQMIREAKFYLKSE